MSGNHNVKADATAYDKLMNLTIDTSKDGLRMCFRPYTAKMLEWMWSEPHLTDKPKGTGYYHERLLNEEPEIAESRASIIFELRDLDLIGVLQFEENTGKGGWHRLYYPAITEKQFWGRLWNEANTKIVEARRDAK